MDLILYRQEYKETGIFGSISSFKTLEHAFPSPTFGWQPIIPPGTFVCVLGAHRLPHMTEDFQTYEITGVEGHSKLLFHWGNWNKDSEGCILLGLSRQGDMLLNSKIAFNLFMKLQQGLERFNLTVV